MPWCVDCGRYGVGLTFHRVQQKADSSLFNYVCRDRAACWARASANLSGKGIGEPRSGHPRPTDRGAAA